LAGLSLRDISERYELIGASRESVREWVHRVSMLFGPSRKPRRIVAVDETVISFKGHRCFIWSAVDVDSGEIIAVYASRGRSLLNSLIFLKMVLKSCENRPLIVVDRGPWYPWALKKLGLEHVQETFGKRNRIERWFRELKDRTKRFCNNVISKALKSIEELVSAIALIHNLILNAIEEGGVILG
ncbi:MAG: DDE-type integrase/transposase/recombinase, partial [Nitrososphaerota archaeon]